MIAEADCPYSEVISKIVPESWQQFVLNGMLHISHTPECDQVDQALGRSCAEFVETWIGDSVYSFRRLHLRV